MLRGLVKVTKKSTTYWISAMLLMLVSFAPAAFAQQATNMGQAIAYQHAPAGLDEDAVSGSSSASAASTPSAFVAPDLALPQFFADMQAAQVNLNQRLQWQFSLGAANLADLQRLQIALAQGGDENFSLAGTELEPELVVVRRGVYTANTLPALIEALNRKAQPYGAAVVGFGAQASH
jgi:hypothetical protein